MSDFKKKTISGLKWSGVTQLTRFLLQFFISIILARTLDVKDFGLIGMISVFSGFANFFVDMGFGSALIQRNNIDEKHLNTVFWLTIVSGIITAILLSVFSPVIANFYHEKSLVPLTIVLSSTFVISSLRIVPESLLKKTMDFRKLAFLEIIAAFISGILAIVFAYKGFGAWALVIQSVSVSMLTTIITWMLNPWLPAWSFNKQEFNELFRFSRNLMGFNLINYWLRHIDKLFIGKWIGAADLGIYTRAYGLMLLPLSQISSVLTRVMFPSFSAIQHDKELVKRTYLKSIGAISLVSFPTMVLLFVVARDFIVLVYGEKWGDTSIILRVLCPVGLLQSVTTTMGWIYTSQGRTDLMFRWGIFAGIANTLCILLFLRWGITGVAWAHLISNYVILWYPSWKIPAKLINLKIGEILMVIAGPLLCSLSMGLFVEVIKWTIKSYLQGFGSLIFLICVGVLFYIAIIKLFNLRSFAIVLETIYPRKEAGNA